MEPVETITSLDGKMRGKIYYDDDARDPREEFDHPTVMVCHHRDYILGDVDFESIDPVNYETGEEYDDIEEYFVKELGAIMVLPLFIYDHSGITISTGRFSCPWDTSCVGYIYMTKKQAIDCFGESYTMEQVEKCLIDDVKEYDDYLTGNVFGFKIFEEKHIREMCLYCKEVLKEYDESVETDSCWGIYGLEWVKEEVNMIIEAYNKECKNGTNV